jgi:hypothetical protein
MNTYGVNGGIAPPLLTYELSLGEWSASRPHRFTPRDPQGTHCIAIEVSSQPHPPAALPPGIEPPVPFV